MTAPLRAPSLEGPRGPGAGVGFPRVRRAGDDHHSFAATRTPVRHSFHTEETR